WPAGTAAAPAACLRGPGGHPQPAGDALGRARAGSAVRAHPPGAGGGAMSRHEDPLQPFPPGRRARMAAVVAVLLATMLAGTALLGLAGGFIPARAAGAGG